MASDIKPPEILAYRGLRQDRGNTLHPFQTRNKYPEGAGYDPKIGVPFVVSLGNDEGDVIAVLEPYYEAIEPGQESVLIRVRITPDNFHLYKDMLRRSDGSQIDEQFLESVRAMLYLRGEVIRINGDGVALNELSRAYDIDVGRISQDGEWEFKPFDEVRRAIERETDSIESKS